MAKTRRQKKRGGAVNNGDYVYSVVLMSGGEQARDMKNTVFKNPDTAMEQAVTLIEQNKPPKEKISINVTNSNDLVFNRNRSQVIAETKSSGYFSIRAILERFTISEELPLKTKQRIAIGQVANKTGIAPDTERTIAEMVGVKGF